MRINLFWKGALSAVGAGLLAFVFAFALSYRIALFLQGLTGEWIALLFLLSFHVANLLFMGLVGSFFWHRLKVQPERWQQLLVILIPYFVLPLASNFGGIISYGPLLFLVTLAFPYVAIATLLSLWPLHLGINWGLNWWPKNRLRHFFGLTNDYERETDETR